MLDKIDLSKKISKVDAKAKREVLEPKLGQLQRSLKEKQIPVMIVFEGLDAAGKGTLINQLILPLDPRGFKVYAINGESKEEEMHPFLWRFWNKTPEKGRIALFDGSWYRRVSVERFEEKTQKEEMNAAFEDINSFEKQLTDGGTLIIKLFLVITKSEQKKRMEKLEDKKATKWRVSKEDWKRNQNYDEYLAINDEMLQQTDTEYAPWSIVEATDSEYAITKIMTAVADAFEQRLHSENNKPKPVIDGNFDANEFSGTVLHKVDLSQKMEEEAYRKELKELQKKLSLLHSELYAKRIPVVLAFEGWDAGGKGGAIKRLTSSLDPRGYTVNPTSSPNDEERAHHYLWRFWTKMPKDGHIAIFDRTWYGRVMVERVEGFCSREDWQRGYKEMNQMEKQLWEHGAVVLKFWMQIDKEEQARRFQERQEIPEKNWKITEEDWRNREKWDLYEKAVDEMLIRTSTSYAPWIIVEGNSKYYARIKVLRTVIDALEERIRQSEE